MATINLDSASFEKTITDSDIVLVDFWAEWCGPCKVFGPIFEKASETYPEITFAKVNTEEQQDLAATFGIRSIPTLAVFREGVMVFMQPGALPAEVLDKLVGAVKELDMEDVRSKIAEEEAKAASGPVAQA